ncbi:hypothetical protein ABZX51_000417 [Aspergillus tubingensis]
MGKPDLWEKALQQLDPEEREKIQASKQQIGVLQTVLSSAQSKQEECQGRQWKYKKRDGTEVEFRQVFGQLVDRLNSKFKSIGDSVAAIDPTHLSVPWAAVGLALQLVVSDTKSYQTILDGLDILSGLIPRYALFEVLYLRPIFPLQNNLEQVLVKLYATMLEYIIKAKEYYGTKTIKRVTKSLIQAYAVFNDRMNEIQEQQRIADELARIIDSHVSRSLSDKADLIKHEQDVLRDELNYFHTPIQFIRDGLIDLTNSFTKHESDNRTTQILQWLSPLSQAGYYEGRRETCLQSTGGWIFEDENYIRWRVSSHSAVLWLHGLPGTGKSTMMSTIIESLQVEHKHSTNSSVAYVFCSRNRSDGRWQDCRRLVCCLIAQLARLKPSGPLNGRLIRTFEDMIQKEGEVAVKEGAGLSWNDACQLLCELIDKGVTTICIDAIDECAEDCRGIFLRLIDRLLTKPDGGRVKVLLSSRTSLNIAERFPMWYCHSVEMGQNGADIQAYARDSAAKCVEGMRSRGYSVSAELEEKLMRHLVGDAQGMFLWIELRAKLLLRQADRVITEEDLLQASPGSPKPLVDLFQDIYDKVISESSPVSITHKLALTVFRWLLCAKAPVPVGDLIEALSVFIYRDRTELEIQCSSIDLRMIIDSCQDLVVIDDDTQGLRFIHTAVRDFLESKDGLQPTKQHATIAELCLATVQNLASASPTPGNRFHSYVVLYWASHVAQAGQEHHSESISDALDELCQERPWFRAWLPLIEPASRELEWNDPYKVKILQTLSSPATSFFTACTFGFFEIVQYCLEFHSGVICQMNENGATGLHLAAEYGHHAIAERLYQVGANLNALDNGSESPLHRAAAGGYHALVLMLLEAGASLSISGRRYGTPLHAAALHGHLNIVDVLLQNGADPAVAGGPFGTALHAACLRGHVSIVKRLLQAGLDVNAAGKAGHDTPSLLTVAEIETLMENERYASDDQAFASFPEWQETTLKSLLEHKVDVNILPGGFGPPLHTAARAGHDAVVNLLLREPRALVNLEGGEYGTALQAAAAAGRRSTVQTLLNAQADPNMQTGKYGTALIAACRRGDLGIARLLIGSGASVAFRVGFYGTALHAACRSGNYLLVQLLLDSGADPNVSEGEYCTALQAAARDGYENIVRLLLNCGADVNSKGGAFGSAIQAAALGGHLGLVELLLAAKAHMGKALQLACLGGHQAVVELLLGHGSPLNHNSNDFGTALQTALVGRHYPLARWLLDKGANASDTGGKLGTAIQLAAGAGESELVNMCLERGADPWEANLRYDRGALQKLGWDFPSFSDLPIRSISSIPIVLAVAGGHDKVVVLILEKACSRDDNVYEYALGIALRMALEKDNKAIVSLLLDQGIPVYREIIESACVRSSPSLIVSLLDEYKRPKSRQEGHSNNCYALSKAALHGRVDLVEVLLQRVMNSEDSGPTDLSSVLVDAVDGGKIAIVNRLLGAGVELTGQPGYWSHHGSVLPKAVANGNRQILHALLMHNMDLNVIHGSYGTALQVAASTGAEDIVIDLLERGANPNLQGGKYGTAVQAAAAGGHEAIVERLISAGANLQRQGGLPNPVESQISHIPLRFRALPSSQRRQSGNHGTALLAAATTGNKRVVEMLVDAGAGIDDVDGIGYTPLHRAAYFGHNTVVAFLIGKGAKVLAKDHRGRTPVHLAAKRGHPATVGYLLASANDSSPHEAEKCSLPLHWAAQHGDIELAKHFIADKSDLEQLDDKCRTALLVAASNGQSSMVDFLLGEGSNVHHHDSDQRTALHLTAASGNPSAICSLLEKDRALLHLPDKQGMTALHHAICSDSSPLGTLSSPPGVLNSPMINSKIPMVALLLDEGACIDTPDNNGITPWEMAQSCEDELKQLLVRHRALKADKVMTSRLSGSVDPGAWGGDNSDNKPSENTKESSLEAPSHSVRGSGASRFSDKQDGNRNFDDQGDADQSEADQGEIDQIDVNQEDHIQEEDVHEGHIQEEDRQKDDIQEDVEGVDFQEADPIEYNDKGDKGMGDDCQTDENKSSDRHHNQSRNYAEASPINRLKDVHDLDNVNIMLKWTMGLMIAMMGLMFVIILPMIVAMWTMLSMLMMHQVLKTLLTWFSA